MTNLIPLYNCVIKIHILSLAQNFLWQNHINNQCSLLQTSQFFKVLFNFQITDFRINYGPSAQVNGLGGGLPVQAIGQVMNQQLTQSSEIHANLVNQPYSNTHVEEHFGGEIIAVLGSGQLEVLLAIEIQSTPGVVDALN